MSYHRKNIGRLGEEIAIDLLKKKNYQIILRNYRTRYGELDIICEKDKKLVFIEVKTKIGTQKGKPYEAVNKRKIIHLKRAISYYLLINKIKDYKLSIGVISIVLDSQFEPIEIKFFENVEL